MREGRSDVERNPLKILIIDDEKEFGLSLKALIESEGYFVAYEEFPLKVEQRLSKEEFHLLICDIYMPGYGGITLLEEIHKKHPQIAFIMLTGYPSIPNAVTAMKLGADNFFSKPIQPETLLQEIIRIDRSHSWTDAESCALEDKIITGCPEMRQILQEMTKIADSNATVLITGESGTGKELIADLLHFNSPRKGKPCIKVNCAALPETLLESELFGVEKGAYTGAETMRIGKFEAANNGTVFLDEIGDMTFSTQSKVLRVLQDHEFYRVGGNQLIRVDIRIVAATNRDLARLITEGKFREDLYYRLSVVNCYLPSLKSRTGDISLLSEHFLNIFNNIYRKQIKRFSPQTRILMEQHSWPGNIRELKNCVERCTLFCEGDEIVPTHLPFRNTLAVGSISSGAEMEEMNRRQILSALEQSRGVRKEAATLLNIDRRTLYNRMKKLGIY